MSKNNLIFILIIILAIFLRFWHLGSVPISLDWDEASWGYNAFSILHTGRDEYGKLFPYVLQSFNDFKPAMYAYLSIPVVAILGLTDFAVRIPNAIFGVLSVILTYFVVKELFKRVDLALVSSFMLAISPWAIQFSRFAHEGTLAIAFNLMTVLFFLKGLKKPYFLILSGVASGLSLYAYQSEKIFAPILILALILIYRKDLMNVGRKYIILFISAGLLVVMPIVLSIIINPSSLNRAKSTNFTSNTEFAPFTAKRVEVDKANKDYIGLVLDNRRIVYVRQVAGGYISHFDPNWLFINGDQPRHHAPGMGLLYLWELPFLLIGIYFLIFNEKINRKSKIFIFTWLFISIIPAAITNDVPHAGRTLNLIPVFQIFTAAGLLSTYYFMNVKIRNKIVKYSAFTLFILIVSFNFIYFLNQYFVQQNYFNSKDWQYGWKEAIDYVNNISSQYDKIVISNVTPLDQSYVFFLFNMKYPPEKYLSQTHDINNHNFEKFEFRNIDWNNDKNLKNTLFVGRPTDFDNAQVLKVINYKNGEEAIKIVKPL